MIGPEWSGAAIPIAEIANASKVPVLATTASNTKVTVDDNGNVQPYMFRMCFIDPYQGTALADFAYKELGKRKAAFITDVSAAYSVGIQQYFEEQFTRLGGQVVAKEGYQANDTEFRAQVSKVAESGADVLVVPTATYRDIALIAKQADALGLKIQYLGGDGWVADELLSMAGAELDGAYLSSGVSTESPEFKDFNEQFAKKHNMQATVYAYYALDALYALEYAIGVAIDKAGSPEPTAVRDALETMKDVPVFTSKLTMEPTTHNPHNKPVVIMQIKDGKWNIVKTYEPQD
jgi:branched-chain amino acid transport system substrate-binding protein